MSQNQYIMTLNKNKFLRSTAEVLAFDQALAALVREKDTNIVPDLLLVFDDRCENPEVMWGLLHFIEKFNIDVQMRAFTKTLPTLIKFAKEWAILFLTRSLYDEPSRLYLKSVLPSLPIVERQTTTSLLQEIADSDEDYQKLIEAVLF